MDLEEALATFDRTETNLSRLESVWQRLLEQRPTGIDFDAGGPEGVAHDELCRRFEDLAAALPALDGFAVTEKPARWADIAGARLSADEVSDPEFNIGVEQSLNDPGEDIREYRHRFERARKALTRRRTLELIELIEADLAALVSRFARDAPALAGDPQWDALAARLREVRRLAPREARADGRWGDLARHVSFGMGVDLHDIANFDWPSVRPSLERSLYGQDEPVPVEVADLGALVRSDPAGPVSTALDWSGIDDEGFERLLFNLLATSPGYRNARWLMATRAPDRGRDLSVERVIGDALGGERTERVIVQCKHWQSRSLSPVDVSDALAPLAMWEPPPVDVLVIVTSGRFSADAVAVIERRDHDRLRPRVEMWAGTHLEMLLADRAPLLASVGLRRRA